MKNNCFINGNGIVESGEYEKVEICGTGVFGSNVFANKVVVNGSASMGEGIEADILEINGACCSSGSVKCNKIFVNGTFKSNKLDILCETLNVKGEVRGEEGEIKAKDIKISGVIFVKNLVGDLINISAQKGALLAKLLNKEISTIEFIEGKHIEIDNVIVKRIDCEKIIVGKNCYIENLNCTGKAEIEKSSSVNHINGNFVYK